MSFSDVRKRELLRQMYTVRAFEEMAEQLYALGKIHGTMHLSIGMEASAVGAVAALGPDDLILSTHRGHGHCIAKGADLKLMMAEFMGKETGYCRGRGGSMHIADVAGGNLGANGVVGGGIPMAMGVGLGLKLQRREQVILCFFGDGAANMGAFHESLNMAAIWNLPVVYVCENNQYAMSFSVKRAFAIERISGRAVAYGMPGLTVDGNDLMAVYEAEKHGVDRARSGAGPTLVENVTYRWRGHSKSDLKLTEWLRELAPSRVLLQDWKAGKISWKQYENRYLKEMSDQEAKIKELTKRAGNNTITLLCLENEKNPCCHRHLLKKLIEQIWN